LKLLQLKKRQRSSKRWKRKSQRNDSKCADA
jgi:hypothetical protein